MAFGRMCLKPGKALPEVASILLPSENVGMRPASKVIATLGPATRSPEVMLEMLQAGVAAARIDLNWGTLQYHLESLTLLQAAAKRCMALVPTCLHLSGRCCRVVQNYELQADGFPIYDRAIVISAGQRVVITSEPGAQLDVPQDPSQPCVIPVSSDELSHVAKVGDTVNVERYLVTALEELCVSMEVERVNGLQVHCVARGQLNIRGSSVVRHLPKIPSASLPAVTPALNAGDRAAMEAFHARGALDFVILGSLDDPGDIDELRDFLDSIGAYHTKMIGTLQSARSLLNFGTIVQNVDAVIISRGALGLHVLPEKMAVIQKRVISLCNLTGKPCIIGSILDSMQENPRPTRAEATDVANSVIDGADAFLLGPETVRGRNPVLCVKTVLGICGEAERVFDNVAHYDNLMEAFKKPTTDHSSSIWVQRQLVKGQSTIFQPELASDGHDSDGVLYPRRSRTPNEHSSLRPHSSQGDRHLLSRINESISASMKLPEISVREATLDADASAASAAANGTADSIAAGGRPPNGVARLPPPPPGDTLVAPAVPPPLTNQADLRVPIAYPPERAAAAEMMPQQRSERGMSLKAKNGSYSNLAVEVMRRGAVGDRVPVAELQSQHGGFNPRRAASWGSLASLASQQPTDGSSPNSTHANQPALVPPRHATPAGAAPLMLTNIEVAASSAVLMAGHIKSPLLLVVTDSGHTASLVAKYRPEMPILALVVPHVVKSGVAWSIEGASIARQCSLLRGVQPMLAAPSAQAMLPAALQRAADLGLVKPEDSVVALVRSTALHTGQCLTVQVMSVGESITIAKALESILPSPRNHAH